MKRKFSIEEMKKKIIQKNIVLLLLMIIPTVALIFVNAKKCLFLYCFIL